MKEFPPCPVAAGRVRSLAPFDDQGYPFSAMKLGPGGGSRVQEMSRTVCVGDQMTHGGQKGFGMTKHGRSGHATRSPRFRFLQKLEAHKRMIARTALGSRTRNSPSRSYSIPGKQHEA